MSGKGRGRYLSLAGFLYRCISVGSLFFFGHGTLSLSVYICSSAAPPWNIDESDNIHVSVGESLRAGFFLQSQEPVRYSVQMSLTMRNTILNAPKSLLNRRIQQLLSKVVE